MVASLAGWDEWAKLVNLTARLRGQAFGFYSACTLSQRASYESLVKELEKRITPVELPAVPTSLFHDCEQKQEESVDDYAQDLRYLFYQAYPKAQQGISEAEEMGKSVLVNQFVNGLIPELKAKLLKRKVTWNNYWLMHALRKLSSVIQDHLRGTLVSNQYNHSFDQHMGLVVDTGLKVRLQPDSNQHSLMVSKLPQRTHSNRYRDIPYYIC